MSKLKWDRNSKAFNKSYKSEDEHKKYCDGLKKVFRKKRRKKIKEVNKIELEVLSADQVLKGIK